MCAFKVIVRSAVVDLVQCVGPQRHAVISRSNSSSFVLLGGENGASYSAIGSIASAITFVLL